jgi:hypothetical protein
LNWRISQWTTIVAFVLTVLLCDATLPFGLPWFLLIGMSRLGSLGFDFDWLHALSFDWIISFSIRPSLLTTWREKIGDAGKMCGRTDPINFYQGNEL